MGLEKFKTSSNIYYAKETEMIKRIFSGSLLVIISMSLCGCVALLAGAGGTALWQAGKVISEETVSMSRAVSVTEKVFKAKRITLTEKVSKNEVTQLRGKNKADKKIAVDVFNKGPKNVKIEVRIGIGEETLARELLSEIKRRL